MNPIAYYIICALLSIGVLVGIALMSKVKTAIIGNLFSSVCMLIAIVITLLYYKVFSATGTAKWLAPLILLVAMVLGGVIGLIWTKRVRMIEMPQIVALFNGFGGAASALVGIISLLGISVSVEGGYFSDINIYFSNTTAGLALAVGMITLVGSLIAAGKLHKILPQKPIVYKNHQVYTIIFLALTIASIIASAFISLNPKFSTALRIIVIVLGLLSSTAFSIFFAIRVGGADMPVMISLLNSLSGVAGSIAGMAIGDILLVAVGGIVGASGLLLTQIMCKAMNRKLSSILLGKTSISAKTKSTSTDTTNLAKEEKSLSKLNHIEITKNAKNIIIVPGYGMALAQAQHLVKQLADKLVSFGSSVRFAIHPVAGRMPGHMNVLLAEADVPYDELYQMEDINDDFQNTDLVIVVGANDVINPAANTAEGTPIYGMPILDVEHAKHIIILNYDLKPGYAGVDNPLYSDTSKTTLLLGDAKNTLATFINDLDSKSETISKQEETISAWEQKVKEAKNVIIVPGYGMALAQAQHLVKKLGDTFEENGAKVRFAIHPVAGRMPGHMNVLLAEADVPYDELYQMEDINDDFQNTDLVVVVGANDVINPAANTAEGTPIYGMPILNVDKAKYVLILNYDLKPGYAGVDNPLYTEDKKVQLLLGDASKTLPNVIEIFSKQSTPTKSTKKESASYIDIINKAQNAIIVPGYGMALAQAQHLVKQLADKLESKGIKVRYAIHPVAGRMPGHMNVLLAEADVPYDELYQMEEINDDFDKTDIAIVVGANDVINPAANTAEGTPIYGMPILNVNQAKHIVILNYDLKPGYAGVDNPLYNDKEKVTLLLGDASETLKKMLSEI